VSRDCWLFIAPLDAEETTVDSSANTRRTLLFPEGNIYRYILSIQPIHKKARLDVGSKKAADAVEQPRRRALSFASPRRLSERHVVLTAYMHGE
jgi:hypothetical protein